MSKLTGLHAIFHKISIYWLIMGFHALTLAWFLGGFKNRGRKSGGYRGNLDQSIVHGRVVDACCPAIFCARTSASTGQVKDTSSRISKLYQNNDVCIDWPLRSSDMSTVEHV